MAQEVIRISDAEAESNFAAVLAQVRAGAEVISEQDAKPIAIIIPTRLRPGRLLSEAIVMAEARGSTTTLDEDFSRDLEDVIQYKSA